MAPGLNSEQACVHGMAEKDLNDRLNGGELNDGQLNSRRLNGAPLRTRKDHEAVLTIFDVEVPPLTSVVLKPVRDTGICCFDFHICSLRCVYLCVT